MLEWLKQRVISWFLSRYVGRWIHVDKNKLHGETQGSVWSLEVNDLLLRKDCLNDYDIPFTLRSGTVKHMKILWKDKHSVQIKVDTIFMVLQSRQVEHLVTTPEQKKDLERQIKEALLEQWDSQLDGVLAPAPVEEDASIKKVPPDAYRAMLDKLEVTISNIHLCFYESKSDRTFGSHIDCITLRNSDPDVPAKIDGHTTKHAEITGLAVYLDTGGVPNNPADMVGKSHDYMLRPISTKATIGYDMPKARFDLSRPKVSLSCSVNELLVHLQREQYLSVVGLLDWWSKSTRFILPRDGRPFCQPGEAQGATKLWWRFVLDTILVDIRERRRKRSLKYLMQRRKDRLRYVALYTKQRGADLGSKEKKEIGGLEDLYDYHDVVFFRCTAIKRLQASSQVVKRKSTSWFRWGTKKGEEKQDEKEAEKEAEFSNPMGTLTEEERNALLSALDVGPVEVGQAEASLQAKTHAEQVQYAVDLRVAMCKFAIQDAGQRVHMSVAVTQTMLEVAGRQRAVRVRAGMHSLNIMDEEGGVPLCRHRGGRHGEEGGELLSVVVDSNQGVAPQELALHVRVSTLQFSFNPLALQAFSAFWAIADPDVDLARARRYAQEAYSELRKKQSSAAGEGAGGESEEAAEREVGLRVRLDVDIAAPHIFVCEHAAGGESKSVLALRLGHLTVKDEASRRPNEQRAVFHNRYAIGVDKVGVDLLREFEQASLSGRQRTVLMQDTQMGAFVDVALPLRAEHEHGVEVDATLAELQARGNVSAICEAVRVAASWSHKPGGVEEREAAEEEALEAAPPARRGRTLGRVLVKGLGKREVWVWRWVTLQGSAVHLSASGDAEAVPERTIAIEAVQVKSDMHKGRAVVVLEGTQKAGYAWGGDLVLFAGPNHSSFISHIRTKQREIDPLLELQAPLSAAPGGEDGAEREAGKRELSMRLTFNVNLVRAVVEKDGAEPGQSLLDLQLQDLSSAYSNRGAVLLALEMATLRVVSEEGSPAQRDVIRPSAAEEGSCLKVTLGSAAQSPGMQAELRVEMKAMSVCVDPVTTLLVLDLQSKVELAALPRELLERGRRPELAAAPDRRRKARGSQERGSQERASVNSQDNALSLEWSRLESSVFTLHEFEAPSELVDAALHTQVRGTLLYFVGTGLAVSFMDGEGRPVWQAEMGRVRLRQGAFQDGSTRLKGVLESFSVSDTSCAQSLHPQLLTMAENDKALVNFELSKHDMTAVHAPEVASEVTVSINQPQITVLFRMINQMSAYAALFSKPADPRAPSAVAERASPAAPRHDERAAVRFKIDLHHPVVIVPRSSTSHEAYAADLGSIEVRNTIGARHGHTSEWTVGLREMKLETLSGRGQRTTMLENVNGVAKMVMAEFAGAGEGGGAGEDVEEAKELCVPAFLMAVDLEEVRGTMTDAQYGLLMCIVGENMTERNARFMASEVIEQHQTQPVRVGEVASVGDLHKVLLAAVAAAVNVPARTVYKVTVPTLDISLCSALDPASTQTTPLFRVAGDRLKINYEIQDVESMKAAATEGGDGLLWQMVGGLSYLEVMDDRPGMRSPLPFLTTNDKATEEDRFRLAFRKSCSFHTGIDLDFTGVSAVADAGLFFSFLGWLGRGSEPMRAIKPKNGDLRYTIGMAGGMIVKTTFDDPAIHLVTDLQQAHVDSFIVKGSLAISYNNLFNDSSLLVELNDLNVFSHLHHGNDKQILGPSSGTLDYSWGLDGKTPANLNVTATGFAARLSHQDVVKVSTVNSTLMRSLQTNDRPVVAAVDADSAPPQQQLSFSLTVTAISVSLEDRDHQEPIVKLEAQRGTCTGTQRGGATSMRGEVLSLAITDTSVQETQHSHILTINEAADTLVNFEYSTFKPTAADYPGHEQFLSLHINQPQITVLWRFIEEVRAYIGSFQKDHPEISRTLSSPLSPRSPETAEERSKKPEAKMKVKIELHHPILIIPRSSRSPEAYVADLGSIEVQNTLTHDASEGKSEWNVILQQMKLETVSSKNHRFSMLEDVNGTARILTTAFAGAERPDAEPELLVEVDLGETKGRMTDAQYGLLMCIIGENMTERRVRPGAESSQGVKHVASMKADAVAPTLANTLKTAADLSKNIRVVSKYCVRIKRLFVGLRLADSLDVSPDEATLMVRLGGDNMAVQFCGLYQDPARTDDRLVWECEAAVTSLKIEDRRPAMAARAMPFLSASDSGKEAQLQPGESPPYMCSLPGTDGFALRARKTFRQHMGIDLKFKGCTIVADFGLLMTFLGWLGRGGKETASIRERVGEYGYTVVSPGGMIVDTRMPMSRIFMVTSFEASKPDGFLVGGSLTCIYASIRDGAVEGSSFSTDVPDFSLRSMSSARQSSNANMLLVNPCTIKYDQQWQVTTHPGGKVSVAMLYAFNSVGLRAMVTYEDTHLIFEVIANIMKNYTPDTAESRRPKPQNPEVALLSPEPAAEEAVTPKKSPARTMVRQGTVKAMPSGAIEPIGEVEHSMRVKLNVKDIKLTFVDDYRGRWIPMLRWNIDNLSVWDEPGEIKGHLRCGLDYFHSRTSTWRSGIEDWDMKVTFSSVGGTKVNIDAEEKILFHVSADMIGSLLRATKTWTQDRREYASVTEKHEMGGRIASANGPVFVPYVVRNYLAEDLVCLLGDGSEHDLPAQATLELTYEQVWKRTGVGHMHGARDGEDESSISHHIFLQFKSETQVFAVVCVEKESTTTHEVPLAASGRGSSSTVMIVCDLAHQDGQKILSVSSMVTVRNRSKVPLMTGVELAGSGDVVQTGMIPADGMIALPLKYSFAGTLTVRPIVNDLDYLWCSVITEGINLRSLHEGTLRISQVVDSKFQRLFGKDVPGDTTLIEWYACANDTDGVMKQGVMYVTDHAICHHSNLIGREHKTIIRIRDIVGIRKVYTALVFPNAIAISTQDGKTWYFRTFINRAEAFRTILQILPNKDAVAAQEDDVDDKARKVFKLAASDPILCMYSASWHHDTRITSGYVLLTTHHLLFMSSSDSSTASSIKLPWTSLVAFEKKKAYLVQNIAILVRTRDGQEAFFASTKWNRDKVIDEDIKQLWSVANGKSTPEAAHGTDKDEAKHAGVRCRTLSCNIIDSLATKEEGDPKDNNQVYKRQKDRAKDTVTWSVVVMDAVTRKVGAERTAGHPCIVELHPPWVIQNFTSQALEVQLIDPVSSVIGSVSVSSGASDQLLAVDLRRELHFRARANPWSPAKWTETVQVHSASRNPELELVVEVPDSDGGAQSVVVEVTKDRTTCGFRICLYNRFWLLNLTGLPLKFHRLLSTGEYTSTKTLANGKPFGFDSKDDTLEVTLEGFMWSDPFSVEKSAESLTIQLACKDDKQSQSSRDLMTKAVPNERVLLDASTSTARPPFDRTTIVTFAPQLVIENCLEEALVVWQRGTAGHHTKWLESGQACAFFPEGELAKCRLSANLACLDSDDKRQSLAVFSPMRMRNPIEEQSEHFSGTESEPVLLECSDKRVILAETVPLLEGHVSTYMLRFREPTEVVPHKIVNLTHYTLGFKQRDSSKSWVTQVRPWQRVKMVWPEPMKPKKLQLVEIDGQLVHDSPAAQAASEQSVDVDDLTSDPQPFLSRNCVGITERLRSSAGAAAASTPAAAATEGGSFILRMHHQKGAPLLAEGLYPGVIELDAPEIVIGREQVARAGVKSVVLGSDGDGEVHGIVSRQHAQISQPTKGTWLLEDLGSTNGVLVNGVRVSRHFLQLGDIVTVGAGKGVKEGQAPVSPWSPFTYMFEDAKSFASRRCKEAGLLQGTVRLDKGTKVVFLSIGDLMDEANKPGASTSFSFNLQSPGLSFLLEDDCQDGAEETEELLYLEFQHVMAGYVSGPKTSQIIASVESAQVSNQFDPQTSFPVIVSIAPSDKGVAFSMALQEKVGEVGVDKYFENIKIDFSEPYIFIDDRLILKLATFFSSFSVSSADRGSESRQTFVLAAKADGQAAADAMEVEAGLSEMQVLLDAVVKGKAGMQGAELAHDPYVYVHNLQTKELKIHLSLMLTEGNEVIRRYAGALLQRVLRNIRVEDIVIKVPEQKKDKLHKKKSAMTLFFTTIFMGSLRQTFYSKKFLFKGLDAWSDKIFNLQSQGQVANKVPLQRIRALPERTLQSVEEPAAPSLLSIPKRAVTTVASLPVQGLKSGLKTGAKQLGRLGNLLGQ